MNQKGTIATTLSILSVFLITAGVLLGTYIASQSSLATRSTEAQTSSPIVANDNNPNVTATFGTIKNRSGTTQKMIDSTVCFKTDLPTGGGSYKIVAEIVTKGASPSRISIGASLPETISTPLSAYKCPKVRNRKIFTYSSLADVPNAPAYADIDHIEFSVVNNSGNWGGNTPTGYIGTMDAANIHLLLGDPPANGGGGTGGGGGGGGTNPEACPIIEGKAPATAIGSALADPTTISGWNQLEDPTQPESSTNLRKRKLSLQDTTKPMSASNSLIFVATCPSTTPAEPRNLNINVKSDPSTDFTGDFDAFEYVVQTCDFRDANSNRHFDQGEALNCGSGGNQKSHIYTQKTIPFETQDPFSNVTSGKRIVQIVSGYYKNYDTAKKKDNSGLNITFASNECLEELHTSPQGIYGQDSCLFDLKNDDQSIDITVKLPDTSEATIKMGYKDVDAQKDFAKCDISADSNGSTNNLQSPCSGSYNADEHTMTLVYSNSTSSAKKIKWAVTHCNGTINAGRPCVMNVVNPQLDAQNQFVEESPFTLDARKKRTCTLKITGDDGYPYDNESDANVRSVVKCRVDNVGSGGGTNGGTPTPAPDDDEIYTYIASVYNTHDKDIIQINTHSCENGTICLDDSVDITIKPKTREKVEFKLGHITASTRFYTVRMTAKFADDDGNGLNLANQIDVSKPQNVYGNVTVGQDKMEGTIKTEIQAADVAPNQCVNAEDAAEVISKLAEFSSPETTIPADINGDGVVNILDLSVVIANFNAGSGCAFNQQ